MPVEKITEAYTQRFTPSEIKELQDMALREDRSVPETVRWIVRRFLYGNSRRATEEVGGPNSGFGNLEGTKT